MEKTLAGKKVAKMVEYLVGQKVGWMVECLADLMVV